jgi:hypothetical protein
MSSVADRRRAWKRREFWLDLLVGVFLLFCLAAGAWLALGSQ